MSSKSSIVAVSRRKTKIKSKSKTSSNSSRNVTLRIVRFVLLPLLLVASIFSTIYLYLYPAFHGCAFPSPYISDEQLFWGTVRRHVPIIERIPVLQERIPVAQDDHVAPFRLLVLADPQLEGDSSIASIRSVSYWAWKKVEWAVKVKAFRAAPEVIKELLGALAYDALTPVRRLRKHIDLLGNDYYLGHIYKTMLWWSQPTHVTVLGDLLGSQWVSDVEFERRTKRFWQRVFTGASRVSDTDMEAFPVQSEELADDAWRYKLINVAGNHDIGYAGDMNFSMVERFEAAFGLVNWERKFSVSNDSAEHQPSIRVMVLNSMNLDTPALNRSLQEATYNWTNSVINTLDKVEDDSSAVLLLTHLPLHKAAGVCVDPPMFRFYPPEKDSRLKEQNHLSDAASSMILKSIFGFGGEDSSTYRNGMILTGHDHEGCDTWHRLDLNKEDPTFTAYKYGDKIENDPQPGIREITQRSMMGEFGGYAGLLSGTWLAEERRWEFQYQACQLGVQHIWWAVHILDLVTLGVLSALLIL